MSRSLKINRHTFEKVPDHVSTYKCHCSWCIASKHRYKRIGEDLLKQGLSDAELPSSHRGRLRVVRLKLDGIQPLESTGKGSPKRVDIDLTKALRKIKLRLKDSP